jgi:hypothetical protein
MNREECIVLRRINGEKLAKSAGNKTLKYLEICGKLFSPANEVDKLKK